METKGVKVRTIKIHDLLDFVQEGRFAIPKLQREFVWDGRKAAKLLDSIVRGMPIGVPMIWDTPRSQKLHLRERYHILPGFDKRNARVWFIIDGQQRVSVLYHSQIGDKLENGRLREVDFGRVVLALGNGDGHDLVQYRRPLGSDYVPIYQVLDPYWRKRLNFLGKRGLQSVYRCRQRLMNYPMRFMFISGKLAEVKECFLRVNTLGMKVTTADAVIARAETLELRDFTHEVRAQIRDPGFKDIPDMPILFALIATQGGTEARGRALDRRVRQLEKEANLSGQRRRRLADDWTKLASCFAKAIDYLRGQFSVLSRDYLGYDYIIAMLALFYFWNGRGPSTHQKGEIQKWFWATCFGQRYSGGEFLRCVPRDTKFFKDLAQKLQKKFHYTPLKDRGDVIRTQYGGRTGIGCGVYCLLLGRHPVSIMDFGLNEIPLSRFVAPANRRDRHHIFPRAVLRGVDESPSRYNSIANICLLTTEENKEIGTKQPGNYLLDIMNNTQYFQRKMDRHLIPHDDESGIWSRNIKRGFGRLINRRADLICEAAEDQAGIRLFRRD